MAGNTVRGFDFDDQLGAAFEHALEITYDPTIRAATETLKLGDSITDSPTSLADLHEVLVADPFDYWALLRRTYDLRNEYNGEQTAPEQEARTRKHLLHELDHGEMARKLGADEVLYGVRIFRDKNDGEILVGPATTFVGRFTKLERAAIYVAPPKPSPEDMIKAKLLGFDSKELVMAQLEAARRRKASPLLQVGAIVARVTRLIS